MLVQTELVILVYWHKVGFVQLDHPAQKLSGLLGLYGAESSASTGTAGPCSGVLAGNSPFMEEFNIFLPNILESSLVRKLSL